MSTVIKGGTVVTAEATVAADVLIVGETIAAVGPNLSGDTIIDAAGCFIMPGGIDPHTHLEMPFMGTTTVDDYAIGTRAALSGGTTMVVDFCIPAPDQSLMDALADWDRRGARAAADYAFHMAIIAWTPAISEAMAAVVARGITTFKYFMAYKGALMVDDEAMFASFRRCAELGAMPLVHAENGDVVAALQKSLLADGVTGPEGHGWSRPPDVEGEAANRAIMLADQAGVPLYIVHTSCIPAHEAIRRARAQGKRVFGEPLIQHLLLDETEYLNSDWDHAARRVMSPPFRAKPHQDDLWNGLRAGSLQVVATDHCAFTTAQKRAGLGDFTKIPNGTGRARRPHAAPLDPRGQHRAADDERVRRGHLDQHRPHPQPLSEEGRDPARCRCRSRRVGSGGDTHDHRGAAGVGDRLQRLRGVRLRGAAANHFVPWQRGLCRWDAARRSRTGTLRAAKAFRARRHGLDSLENGRATRRCDAIVTVPGI